MRDERLILRLSMSGSAVVAPIVLALSAIACGPTAPSRPVALTITISRDVLIVAETATLSASVRLSNGRTQIVTPLWTAEDATIGRLSDAGTVIAVTPGTTTITATCEGLMAAQRLRVVPDHRGSWTGRARVADCSCSSACTGLINGDGSLSLTAPSLTRPTFNVRYELTSWHTAIDSTGRMVGDFTTTQSAVGFIVQHR